VADTKDEAAKGDADEDVSLDEFDVVETDAQGRPLPVDDKKPATEQGTQDDTVQAAAHDDDDDDEERIALSEDDAEKREQRRRRKERRRLAMERDRRQIELLTEQNRVFAEELARIRQRQAAQETGQLSQRLDTSRRQLQQAEAILQDALSKNDPARVVKAMGLRDEASRQYNQLVELVERYQSQTREPAPTHEQLQQRQPSLPPIVMEHVNRFREKNPWYDPAGGDTDSRIVLTLDDELANEGYDPASPSYWRELDRRVAQYLPHRTQKNGHDGGQRRSPPVSGSGANERSGAGGKRAVYISPERKQAMIEAGKWDDPKDRARMIKYYAEQDAKDAAANRGAR
jgi:hypothetical protein